jgi:protein-L-isoaspartate(D-aspartate) O-methyltransferase
MSDGDWPQCVIEFANPKAAERVAVEHLRPELAGAHADGLIAQWSFIRKRPFWRLRYRPTGSRAGRRLAGLLDRLAYEGRIVGWTSAIYEPETIAFGGAAAMEVAHELFHHDSRNILEYLARPARLPLGRRELALLLASLFMRAAAQDWYEQGDIWARVARYRPAESGTPPFAHPSSLRAAAHWLMTVDASPTSVMVSGGPLAAMAGWAAAFEQAGQAIVELVRRGHLERGPRAVLAHHLIFFFNRLGLSYGEQHTLSALAKEIVMDEHDAAASAPEMSTAPATARAVKAETTGDIGIAESLRNTLVDQLRGQGTVRTARVEAALRAVPRHVFVPAVTLEKAYADDAVYTKEDGTGVQISAASQPAVVAMMLEQLDVQPGHRALELGAGTGYNAGLLSHLVGEGGHVTTIDVDEDIVAGARSGLAAAGCQNVLVISGDGALGHADGAPFDRVIATVGAFDLPLAWLEQLAPGGRLVVPLRLRGSVSRSIAFEHDDGRWRSRTSEMCTFMPLRASIADDPRRMISLTADGAVVLQTNTEQAVDAAALAGIFDQPRHQAWTGVLFGSNQSFEWLYLWLTCTTPCALSRMPVENSAIDAGLVTPQFGWGAMATAHKGDLAYLTMRPTEPLAGNGRPYEVGVIGHGPGGDALANEVAEQIRIWDRDYRSRTVQFEIQPTDVEQPSTRVPGRFVVDRSRTRLIISWS